MKPTDLLEILETAGKLKLTMRHCWIDGVRQESTAEHSWRLALMAMLLKDEEEPAILDDLDMLDSDIDIDKDLD